MYYRIKNHIVYLPCVISAEADWANGGPAILINLTGAKHTAIIVFSNKEERNKEFDALCEKLLESEAI
jgi:hypothetical protein